MIDISIAEIIEQVFGICMTIEELNKLIVRKDVKDELTIRVCETKNPKIIHEFSSQMKGLSKENLQMLTNAINETKSLEEKCGFINDINNLTEDNIDVLLKSIFDVREEDIQFQKRKIA